LARFAHAGKRRPPRRSKNQPDSRAPRAANRRVLGVGASSPADNCWTLLGAVPLETGRPLGSHPFSGLQDCAVRTLSIEAAEGKSLDSLIHPWRKPFPSQLKATGTKVALPVGSVTRSTLPLASLIMPTTAPWGRTQTLLSSSRVGFERN